MSEKLLPGIFGVDFRYISAEICDYGTYVAGIDGTIRSCAKTPFWEILNISIKPNGYASITLYKDKIGKTYNVHTLILTTFLGSCPPGMEGCHGPLGKLNNSLENLYYGTPFQNNYEDKHRDGTMLTGERHPNFGTTHINPHAQFTDDEIRLIRKLYREGHASRDLGRKFHVAHSTIQHIVKYRIYKYVK